MNLRLSIRRYYLLYSYTPLIISYTIFRSNFYSLINIDLYKILVLALLVWRIWVISICIFTPYLYIPTLKSSTTATGNPSDATSPFVTSACLYRRYSCSCCLVNYIFFYLSMLPSPPYIFLRLLILGLQFLPMLHKLLPLYYLLCSWL